MSILFLMSIGGIIVLDKKNTDLSAWPLPLIEIFIKVQYIYV